MATPLEITDADIALVAQELQLDLADPQAVAVLKEATSCDVQAGPGSGKTTILTAKLAILAKKWPYRDRGICVLSHTNVARREIEQKLGRSAHLRMLLGYPHFIGTFQTFVDQFLAVPFLRKERVEVTAVDDDRFGERAWAMLRKNSWKAAFAIQKFCGNDAVRAQSIVASLTLDGAHMGVIHSMQNASRFPGPDSATGQALIAVKQAMREEGCFRYDDMFAFAEACLFKVPYVAPALRRRFPWVFVDELQDTKPAQDRIVEQVFATGDCVFQRFGDKNQAIFDFEADFDDGQSLFGRRKTLFLNRTHRFGQSVADLVSRLTAVEPQQLVGNPKKPSCQHAVMVFRRVSVKSVVPLFGDLVLQRVPAEVWKEHPVCVVASRVNPGHHTKDRFPTCLGDYLEGYVSPNAAKPTKPDSFLGYVIEGRRKWAEEGTGASPYNSVLSGVLCLLRRGDAADARAAPKNKAEFHQVLLQNGRLAAFQRLCWGVLNPVVAVNAGAWPGNMKELLAILDLSEPTEEVLRFLEWADSAGTDAGTGVKSSSKTQNIHQHRTKDALLPIRFDSIHGVKGETHAATLVVETFGRQHDLQQLLPVLTGQTHGSQLKDSLRSHCKRAYVGMTRPSHLLCLGISAEHINDAEMTALVANGWEVIRL
jgi:hypothetical protein